MSYHDGMGSRWREITPARLDKDSFLAGENSIDLFRDLYSFFFSMSAFVCLLVFSRKEDRLQ